jgi:hypothetical protein
LVITASLRTPQPVSIKRLPWMRRIQLYSPKAARMLVLFSYEAVATWALAESSPLVETFCEYPGFVALDGTRTLADFWVQGADREQFIKIEGGIALKPESAERVKTYADTEISLLSADWLVHRQVWIDNWLQINPYLVSNTRFVSSKTLDRVAALCDEPRPLFEIEHAMRDVDAQLVRTAVFMLLHQGLLVSDDLAVRPLAITTVFRRDATHTKVTRPWPA